MRQPRGQLLTQIQALEQRLFASTPATALAARLELGDLLLRLSAPDLFALEHHRRLLTTTARSLDRARLRAHSQELGGDVLPLLATWHPSGYVRQEALHLLASRNDGAELPFLLLRANDWVAPVQQLATTLLLQRLHPGYAQPFMRSLFLVMQLQHYRRWDQRRLFDNLRTQLQSPSFRPALEEALTSSDQHISRAAFQLALWPTGDDPAAQHELRTLLLRALRCPDILVRVWAARAARAHLYGKPLRELMSAAKRDPAAPVRREALLAFTGDFPELRQVLLDPCYSIREAARYYIRHKAKGDPRQAGMDFAAFYTEALAADPLVALKGLGETGSAADTGAVLPYVSAERPRVRRAALEALGRLDAVGEAAVLLVGLRDPQPAVARTAYEALRGKELTPAQLRELFSWAAAHAHE